MVGMALQVFDAPVLFIKIWHEFVVYEVANIQKNLLMKAFELFVNFGHDFYLKFSKFLIHELIHAAIHGDQDITFLSGEHRFENVDIVFV